MRLIFFIILLFITNNAFAVQEIKTKSQLTAWLVEEHSLPITSFRFVFQNSGSAYDPDGKSGLAQFTAGMLNEGAGDYNALAFKKRLEELAISLQFSVDKDNFYINIKTLQEYSNEAIELLMLAITQPSLKIESIEQLKRQTIISIENDAQSPRALATLEWNKLAYKNHPYSNSTKGSIDDINAIQHSDIQQYIANTFHKDNLQISIVGDITKSQAVRLMGKTLDNLPAKHTPTKKLDHITDYPLGQYSFIQKDNPQSVIVFGTKAVTYKDDDFYPAYILNHILGGGGFESRLVDVIREKHALTYSVYSYLSIYKYSAVLKGSLGTKNKSVKRAIELLKNVFNGIVAHGITAKELQAAKQYLIGSYPLRMDTNEKLANGLAFIQMENLGIDFIDKRNQFVQNVTLQQVNDIAKQLLPAENLIITVVGGK